MNVRAKKEIEYLQGLESDVVYRLTKWMHGERSGPARISYFPSNTCNLKCAICWQRKGVYDYVELTSERQLNLVDEAASLGVKLVTIGGGGEPLSMWLTLRDMFHKIKLKGMHGLLFTNGTLITPEIASDIVGIGWDKVLISMDGLKNTNDFVRSKGSYEKIIAGLSHILNARGSAKKPVIGVGCVLTRQVISELPDIIRFLGEKECDQFNLIRLVVHLPEQRKFALSNKNIIELPVFLEKAIKMADEFGLVTNLKDYLDSELVSNTERFDKILLSQRTISGKGSSFWDSICFEPFTNIVIHADGAVGSCCMSGNNTIANLSARTLEDIWFGEEFTRIRKGIQKRQPAVYCRICDLNIFQETQRLRAKGDDNNDSFIVL